ncbi:MAG: prolyl 4-hydroxylase, partial [Colwellia sp.]
MLFLNNSLKGGVTQFTRIDKTFSPKRGTALLSNSLTPQGRENIESMHWGMPV